MTESCLQAKEHHHQGLNNDIIMVLLLAKVLGSCRRIEYTEEFLPGLETPSDGKKLRHFNQLRGLFLGLVTEEELALRKRQMKRLIPHPLTLTPSGETMVHFSIFTSYFKCMSGDWRVNLALAARRWVLVLAIVWNNLGTLCEEIFGLANSTDGLVSSWR